MAPWHSLSSRPTHWHTFHMVVADLRTTEERKQFTLLSQDNLERLFEVTRKHAERYIVMFSETDQNLPQDSHVVEWLTQFNQTIPQSTGIEWVDNINGRYQLAPIMDATHTNVIVESITKKLVARLVATFIYLATVQHDRLGSGL